MKKFFKFEAEGQEFVMFLRFTFLGLSTLEKFKITLEQIIQTVKGQNNYGNNIPFSTLLVLEPCSLNYARLIET